MIDCTESVFSFQQVSGMVKADSRVTLPITFTPSAPINYYRRITCLVHNQVSITTFFSFTFDSLFFKRKKNVLETVGRKGKGRHKVTKGGNLTVEQSWNSLGLPLLIFVVGVIVFRK